MFKHTPSSTGDPSPPGEDNLLNRSCCCPARPAILVLMPPTATRPHETDLLLCEYHFRESRRALSAAGAAARRLRD